MDSERTKRSHWHDYHEKCIYLITVTVKDRKPLLGVVKGDVNKAWISLSQEGKAVWSEIEALPKRYPQVRVLQHKSCPTMYTWCCMSQSGCRKNFHWAISSPVGRWHAAKPAQP